MTSAAAVLRDVHRGRARRTAIRDHARRSYSSREPGRTVTELTDGRNSFLLVVGPGSFGRRRESYLMEALTKAAIFFAIRAGPVKDYRTAPLNRAIGGSGICYFYRWLAALHISDLTSHT